MAYDRKTRTVTTDGDKKQLENDAFAFFAHADEEIQAELAQQAKNRSWAQRIKSLSRTTRLSIVVFVFWSLFVWFRTAGSYEILGYDFYRWDDDYLFINWLVIPAVLFSLATAIKWALKRA